MQIISSSQSLIEFCKKIQVQDSHHFITIDTEFQREKTYWPLPCLIQIGASENIGIVDVLAEGIDLSPLKDLFLQDNLLKVFHSGRQDIEIFHHIFAIQPTPVFDTQIAAAFCGYGDGVSYKTLANDILGIEISKEWQYSDWTQRPLDPQQVNYAAQDVILLRRIYEKLFRHLREIKRFSWALEDSKNFYEHACTTFIPQNAWKTLKVPPHHKSFMKEIAAISITRETWAQKKNILRGHILPNHDLFLLSKTIHKTLPQRINHFGKVSPSFLRAVYDTLETLPQSVVEDIFASFHGPPLDAADLQGIKNTLNQTAKELNLPQSIIGTQGDVRALFDPLGPQKSRILQGWRYETYGKKLLEKFPTLQ